MREGAAIPSSAGALERAYRQETQALLARRVTVAVLFFLVFGAAIGGLELTYYPERASLLLSVGGAYLGVCLALTVLVRWRPGWVLPIAAVASDALALCMAAYAFQAKNRPEMLVLALALFLTGLVVLFPWGSRGQLLGSVGTLLGYPLAMARGAAPVSAAMYGLCATISAVVLTAVGADLLDRNRFASYRRAAELESSEAFANVLLQLASALSERVSEPEALAQRLVEHTRQALAADFVVLFRWDESAQSFHLAAESGTPPPVANELSSIGFEPQFIPRFYGELVRAGAVAVRPGKDLDLLPAALRQRWGLSASLSQAIRRGDRVIAILGCCYTDRRIDFTSAETRLMSAIAGHAAVALENARLMQEARAADRVKSEFVATVSHELRTPLNVIVGYTDLLRDGVFEDSGAERAEALGRIRQQSLQLLDLIQAILDVNRLDAGGLRLMVEAFPVDEMLDALRASVPESWRRPGVRLEWPAGGSGIFMRSDRTKLEMILRNLLHNALKYTQAGVVGLSIAEPHAGWVRFSVSDTGPGISAEDLPAIFDMFRQGSLSPPRGDGVGLGLYIVRRLTEALGGQVSVDSRVGAGSRFSVQVPLQAPRHYVAAEPTR